MMPRRAAVLVVIPLLAAAVAACSIGRAQIARDAREQMEGMSREALLACAGQPRRTIAEGDQELFVYEAGTPDYDALVGRDPGPVQQITGTSTPRHCEATIMLHEGTVRSVSYRGNTGGTMTQGEACASIVERCVGGGS